MVGSWLSPLDVLVDLIAPSECTWCLTPIPTSDRLCASCAAVFEPSTECCQRCAMPLPAVVDRTSCLRCRDKGWRFSRVVALGPYRGRLREAIILMKKSPFEALAMAAGQLLANRLRAESVEFDLVLPVPNHWTRRVTSRASAPEAIATAIATQLRKPLAMRACRRTRRTQKQGMLAWSNRPGNVHHAFRVSQPWQIRGKKLLVVDDVFTSGATAAELTRTLLKAGARSVAIGVAARGTGTADHR